jgi:flagellar basal-body rod protein FlgG
MYKALFTAASGMSSQQKYIDTIANNLANVNTNGFKASSINFQDLLYESETPAGTESTEGSQMPTGLEIGSGVRAVSTTKIFRQGEMEQTGNPLDIAIQGDGFFRITLPDGTTGYTRDGNFGMDGQHRIVRNDGLLLADSITLPSDQRQITVGTDGGVYTINGVDSDQTKAGSIQLAVFANPAGLQSCGNNIYKETAASGAPVLSTPGQDGIGDLRQKFLERSNVDTVTELVHLITAQRAYEISTKAVTIADKILQQSNNLVR